jgi:hypothetical protein
MPPSLADQVINLVGGPHGATATVDVWHKVTQPKTLVVSAHGYQASPTDVRALQALDLARAHPMRSYAFVVPWDRALNNVPLLNGTQRLADYVRVFQSNTGKFGSARPPSLYLGPYIYSIGLPAVLEAAFEACACDVIYLSDANDPATGYMDRFPLSWLLRSACPRGGGSFLTVYSDFLLLCCRTDTARGSVGAPHHFPDGLYPIDLRPRLLAHPFRGQARSYEI